MFIDLSEKQQETIAGGHHEVNGTYDVDDSDVLNTGAEAKGKLQSYLIDVQAYQTSLNQLAETLSEA